MGELDPYAVLGVDPACPQAEIARAWRRIARAAHPDTGSGSGFDDAYAAYALVRTPELRAAYDERRRAEQDRRDRLAAGGVPPGGPPPAPPPGPSPAAAPPGSSSAAPGGPTVPATPVLRPAALTPRPLWSPERAAGAAAGALVALAALVGLGSADTGLGVLLGASFAVLVVAGVLAARGDRRARYALAAMVLAVLPATAMAALGVPAIVLGRRSGAVVVGLGLLTAAQLGLLALAWWLALRAADERRRTNAHASYVRRCAERTAVAARAAGFVGARAAAGRSWEVVARALQDGRPVTALDDGAGTTVWLAGELDPDRLVVLDPSLTTVVATCTYDELREWNAVLKDPTPAFVW